MVKVRLNLLRFLVKVSGVKNLFQLKEIKILKKNNLKYNDILNSHTQTQVLPDQYEETIQTLSIWVLWYVGQTYQLYRSNPKTDKSWLNPKTKFCQMGKN